MFQNKRIGEWDDTNLEESKFGIVDFDHDKCNGCSWCSQICPAKAIEVVDKKAQMITNIGCMFCGCCQAICPEGSVVMKEPPVWPGYYTILERGELKKPRLSW